MRMARYISVLSVVLVVVFLSTSVSAGRWSRRPAQKSAPESAPEVTGVVKTIAIGDVDAGFNMSGGKAYDVKETIQIGLKHELENIGRGRYNVTITSPAVVVEGAESAAPTLPADRAPTQAELAKYMAHLQSQQKQMSGEVKVHKPVAADAFFDFKVESGSGSADTGGAMSTLSRFTGIDTSLGDVSTKTTKVYLICNMRDPATGALMDRYVAKSSSVRFQDIGGFRSYDYGDSYETRQRLFSKAIQKCAKWISQTVR